MPTITARSIGTKLILYDLLTTSNGFTDYGIGMEPNHMWFTIGGSTVATNGGYKFYTNTNNIATTIIIIITNYSIAPTVQQSVSITLNKNEINV